MIHDDLSPYYQDQVERETITEEMERIRNDVLGRLSDLEIAALIDDQEEFERLYKI